MKHLKRWEPFVTVGIGLLVIEGRRIQRRERNRIRGEAEAVR